MRHRRQQYVTAPGTRQKHNRYVLLQTWLAATQVPLAVIVGLDDTGELPLELIPGQKGKNRFTIAQNWIADMAAFAEENGSESRFSIDIIPGIGHSMGGLLPYSQKALISHQDSTQ